MAGEEECLLEQYLIIARSVTHAQRMERELRRLGIRAALQAIDGMRLRPAAIFFQDGNGYREVAL